MSLTFVWAYLGTVSLSLIKWSSDKCVAACPLSYVSIVCGTQHTSNFPTVAECWVGG